MKHFLRDDDLSVEEHRNVLSLAHGFAASPIALKGALEGKQIGLLFQKPSLRTRVSCEVACVSLGAYPVILRAEELHFSRGESTGDSARVLSSFLSLLAARVISHTLLEDLAAADSLPIVNALSDRFHPLQALGDLLTLRSIWGSDFSSKTLCYVGDGNNVCSSLLLACAMSGLSISVGTPERYRPPEDIVLRAKELASSSGATITVMTDPKEAAFGADAIYTDVWTSMGFESEKRERMETLQPFQVNSALLSVCHPRAVILHCLPAHRGEEIASELVDSPRSVIFKQAHNRLPATQALLLSLLQPAMAEEIAWEQGRMLEVKNPRTWT